MNAVEASATQSTPDALTLVLPLRKKESISLDDFYDYWLNAHVTMPPRFPGISSIWLHVVSFDKQTWPRLEGVSNRPEEKDEFHGVPEATFPTVDDLAAFQQASGLQMDDGINFLAEQLAYRSMDGNTATLVEQVDPAPDGRDSLVRHLVFLRRRADVPVEDFRHFLAGTLAPAYAASSDIVKLRRHLFEEVELTLDHPGVAMFKPVERQYQGALEVVMEHEESMARFVGSPAWTETAAGLAEHCAAVHAVRVERCITTKYRGEITLAGVRGVAAADAIKRLDAKNQLEEGIAEMFLPARRPVHP